MDCDIKRKIKLVAVSFYILMGMVCSADDESLFRSIKNLASSGNVEAQYHLGMFYNNGIGTSKNVKKAFEFFKKSSDGGDPLGSYKVGCYYAGQGNGVIQQDKYKALKYKLIAAQAGYVRAQYDVAVLYLFNGDSNNAIKWFEKAMLQGYPDAFFALFTMYYQDKYHVKDWQKAYKYLLVINKNMDQNKKKEIAKIMEKIEQVLSASEIKEAKIFAENVKPVVTKLTIKANNGKEESIKLIENLNNN